MPTTPADTGCKVVLAGRYTLLRLLSEGPTGVVYEAADGDRRIAIKILGRAARDDDRARQRFEREAKAVSLIRSRYTMPIVSAGRTREGVYWLAFPWVDGETLEQRRKRARMIAFERAFPIVMGVLRGLVAAHASSIVHRDVKPANVIIEKSSGMPIILDFGLSKMIAEMGGISSTGLTREGAFLGTPAYAAPEILEDARKAEPSSDVYATATMAFELLTGRLPFSSRHDPLFSTKLVERPRGLRDVTGAAWPPPLESWFERALARQPGRRFATTAQALASWRSLGNEAGPSRWVLAEARDASRIEETTWDDPG